MMEVFTKSAFTKFRSLKTEGDKNVRNGKVAGL